MFRCVVVLGLLLACTLPVSGEPEVGFFGRGPEPLVDLGDVLPDVMSPEAYLGYPLGDRPARHAETIRYFRYLDSASNRVSVFPMGATYEGRELIYAVVASPERLARLDEIRSERALLRDPRTLSAGQVNDLAARLPACVWLAYSIHGDEISGVDAALGVAYRLAAGRDSVTLRLLQDLVIVIDPIENPDGRERYLAQMESYASAVPNADGQSLQKGGVWPWGRGNHYLFDMNRDWFSQELVESKARVKTIMEWQPQVLVDAHEMGQWDTYLFSPPRAPINLHITPELQEWWHVFAADQARAFDRHAWPYYTREWNDEWFPGFGSSWPLYFGAVGILYEQAGVSGSRISQHDGTVLTYSESVAHQYVSSIANLRTASERRADLVRHYIAHRQKSARTFGGGPARAYLVKPDANPDRRAHLAETLERQEIQVFTADQDFTLEAQSYFGTRPASQSFPKGTLIVPTDQPTGQLIQTVLGFDWRLSDSFLVAERRELLKHQDTKMYEVSSWSMLLAYGLDAYSATQSVSVPRSRWQKPVVAGAVRGTDPKVGFGLDMSSDRSLRALAALFERGLVLEASTKDLDAGGVMLPRGAVIVPRRPNPANYAAILDTIARETGAEFVALESGRGALGPDLGGGDVEWLRAPRVALAADVPASVTNVGHLWFLFDQRLGLPVSLVELSRLSDLDLSIYNVLILPDTWGSPRAALGDATERIKTWVRGGGTLIAVEGSAAYCADSASGLSSVRLRSQVLERLAEYEAATELETTWETPDITKLQIWNYTAPDSAAPDAKKAGGSVEELKRAEEAASLFSPRGAMLRVELDTENWLTAGMGKEVPVLVYSDDVFLAKYPDARTVARFADAPSLRLSGLLWPEARERLARSAYCTREQLGAGQIILFAGQPNFRAYCRGSERLLVNAVLYGPGLGTRWTPRW